MEWQKTNSWLKRYSIPPTWVTAALDEKHSWVAEWFVKRAHILDVSILKTQNLNTNSN